MRLLFGEEHPTEDRWGNLGIENNNEQGFTIYPNPATESIAISSSNSQTNISAIIYSISGKKIKEVPSIKANQSMDISTLGSGIYIITIESPEKVRTTQKLVIK